MPNQKTNNRAELIRDFVLFGLLVAGFMLAAITVPAWVIDLPSVIFGGALAGMTSAAARAVVTR